MVWSRICRCDGPLRYFVPERTAARGVAGVVFANDTVRDLNDIEGMARVLRAVKWSGGGWSSIDYVAVLGVLQTKEQRRRLRFPRRD